MRNWGVSGLLARAGLVVHQVVINRTVLRTSPFPFHCTIEICPPVQERVVVCVQKTLVVCVQKTFVVCVLHDMVGLRVVAR